MRYSGRLLLALFVAVPIIEIYVIIQVGQWIGALPTVLLLIIESCLGAWIVKREGMKAWQSLNSAVAQGQLPAKEIADSALILVGGTLLLTPGFVTDIFGFFFVLPPTRPLARKLLALFTARRVKARVQTRSPFAEQRGDTYQIYRDDER